MAPNHAAANVLGTMGTICWTGQIIPQIWKSWREKSTKGMSDWLMLIWGVSSVPMGAYALLQNLNIPLIIQPQLFGLLCLISWGQCQYYERRCSLRAAFLLTTGIVVLCGGVELLLVLTVRPMSNQHGKDAATKVFGVFSAVLISGALLPQYYEIYKYKAVMGISLVFLGIDMLGGLLNDLSLAFSEEFDVLAAISYTLVIVLDGIILILAGLFKLRDWKRGRRAQGSSAADPATGTSPDLDVELQEQGGGGKVPKPKDEHPQHLTVLSRIGSRLSDTPGMLTWTVGDNTIESTEVQRAESEKGRVEVNEKCA